MLSATKLKKAKTLKVLSGEINSRRLIDFINASPDIEELDLSACRDAGALSDIIKTLKKNNIQSITSLIVNSLDLFSYKESIRDSLAEMFEGNHTIKKFEGSCNLRIINSLNGNSTLMSLNLLDSFLRNPSEMQAIADMLKINKTLASLALSLPPVNDEARASYLAITAAIKESTTLASLTLKIYFSELDELIKALQDNYSLTEINLISFSSEEDNYHSSDAFKNTDSFQTAQKIKQAFLRIKTVIQGIIERNKACKNKEETHLAALGPLSEIEIKTESGSTLEKETKNEVIFYQESKEDALAEVKEEKIFDACSLIEEIYDNSNQDKLLFQPQAEAEAEDKQRKENDHLFLAKIKSLIAANLIGLMADSLNALLCCAAHFGYEETAAYLLERKPYFKTLNLNLGYDYFKMRVDSDSTQGHYELIRAWSILNELNIHVSEKDEEALKNNWPPLLLAVLQGHYSIADKLITAGAKVNIDISCGIQERQILFWLTEKKAKAAAMRFFISRGADIEAMRGDGRRALHFSALYDDDEGAKILIRSGAKINPKAKRSFCQKPYQLAKTLSMRKLLDLEEEQRCERVLVRHQAYAIAQVYTQGYNQHSSLVNKIPRVLWLKIIGFLGSTLESKEVNRIGSAAFLSILQKRKVLATTAQVEEIKQGESKESKPLPVNAIKPIFSNQESWGFFQPKNQYRNPKVAQSLSELKKQIAEQITYYDTKWGFRYKIKAARLQAALDRAKNITDFASMQELYNFKGGRNMESIKEAFSYARWGGFFCRKRQSQEKIESFIRNYEYKR